MTALPRLETAASPGFARWLDETGCALAFVTGRDGRLVLVGTDAQGEPALFARRFGPLGAVWARDNALLLAGEYQVWRLENALAPGETAEAHDRLYVPQAAFTTGEIAVGDLAVARNGAILMTSGLFNCVAVASDAFSFTPLWRPSFVSDLVPEDRCHLTGMAVIDGTPRAVSVAAVSDQAGGWKARVAEGGCVVDLRSDEFVARGLSLPVAPRFHGGRLWLLEAGSGWLGYVDPTSRTFAHVAFCPGLPRGLDFVGDFAVCAVAADPDLAGAGSLAIGATLERFGIPAQCAVLVVDTTSGEIVEWLRIEEGADDIAGVAVLEGARRPAAIALDGEDIRRVLSIAPERARRRGADAARAADAHPARDEAVGDADRSQPETIATP